MVYLMNWRMQVACELLEAGDKSLALIASEVGYSSESAFGAAFTRIVKRRPGSHRKPYHTQRDGLADLVQEIRIASTQVGRHTLLLTNPCSTHVLMERNRCTFSGRNASMRTLAIWLQPKRIRDENGVYQE
jgi:hypothetical protein